MAANSVGALLTYLLVTGGVLCAHALPHHKAFVAWHAVLFCFCLGVLIPVHELLHAIGLRGFARVPWTSVKFGIMWRALMPYCHCTVPIPVAAYRRMALLPLWITGGASLAALLAFPTDWLAVFAGVAVAACVGDVWMVAKLRGYADECWVQDSPTEIGCDVFSSAARTEA